MKRMHFPRLILFAVLAAFAAEGHAQDGKATVTKGEKATFYIISAAPSAQNCNFSPDGKYLGGDFTPTSGAASSGFIYDIEADTTLITAAASCILSPDWFAGGYTIFKDGDLMEIESRYTGDAHDELYTKAMVWCASNDMTKVVSMGCETDTDPATGLGISPNYPYIVDGSTGKIIERVEPYWPMSSDPALSNIGFGARANACNHDATILAGHSRMPGASSTWSPVFWDLANDTSFFVGDDQHKTGSIQACNHDGTLLGGSSDGKGPFLVRYDREHMTWTKEDIPVNTGNVSGFIQDISETGLAICIQTGGDGDYKSYLYNLEDQSSILLEDYLRELYGLECPIPCYMTLHFSNDGRMICGWSYSNGSYVPWFVQLEDQQIFARPRFFSATQRSDDFSVQLRWEAPLKGQYTLKGYNVYCDSVQLNTSLISKDSLQFTQSGEVESGIHAYTVQAVYEEGVSDFLEPIDLLVTTQPGCLPVQEIGSEVEYNRHISVYWSLPSARMASTAHSPVYQGKGNEYVETSGFKGFSRKIRESKGYANTGPDLFRYERLNSTGKSCALVIGQRVFTGHYQNNTVEIYNLEDMQLTGTYTVEGASSVNNMAYHDGQLYIASAREEILVLDPETMEQVNRLKTETLARHLCYIPDLDGGKGGFAYGDWRSLHFCNRYGQSIEPGVSIDIEGLILSGSAYHDGKLYLFSQTGESQCELYTVDFSTGAITGKKDLGEEKRLTDISAYGFVAGGMGISVLSDSTTALTAILQFPNDYTHLAFMEIESSPYILGYNLYRNGERINPEGEYIPRLQWSEDMDTPGTYTYTVETVNREGCTSMLEDVSTTVTITPRGECAPPVLTAFESNQAVHLAWTLEEESGPSLAGFNIYRNGEEVSDLLLDLKYTDYNLEKGRYCYLVEAFYENSCTASDSVEIEVTHEGCMMPPSNLDITSEAGEQGFEVKVDWDLPYFETPLPEGYANLPYGGIALASGDPLYAATGWDSAVLDPYRDLYVAGIEYFIGEGITSVEGFVYLNDTMVCLKKQEQRIKENNWNTLMFDECFSMDQPMEVVVGYKVTYKDKSKGVAIYDMGPANPYANLLSADGRQWSRLTSNNIQGNWCINALLVRKRDLEAESKEPSFLVAHPVVKTEGQVSLALSPAQTIPEGKATSGSIRLTGFNIYRDGTKLNDEIVKDFSFSDQNVAAGSYEYAVAAVYGNGEEESSSLLVDLFPSGNLLNEEQAINVFPNPASQKFRVVGDFESLDIFDRQGRLIGDFPANSPEIDITGLAAGTYMLRFVLPDQSVLVKKLVVL